MHRFVLVKIVVNSSVLDVQGYVEFLMGDVMTCSEDRFVSSVSSFYGCHGCVLCTLFKLWEGSFAFVFFTKDVFCDYQVKLFTDECSISVPVYNIENMM